MRLLCLSLAVLGAAVAQVGPPIGYPGGYPPGGYPPGYPGGYPPGYPGGYPPGTGPGIPLPRRGKDKKSKDQGPLPSFRGKLKQMDSKSLRLELDDYRVMEFRITSKTKYLKDGEELKSPQFQPGDQLSVEGSEEADGSITAVNVYWEKAGSATGARDNKDGGVDTWKDAPQDSAPRPATEAAPPPASRAPDDPGPPRLRRGKPVEPATGAPAPPQSAPTPAELSQAEPQTATNLPPRGLDLPKVAVPLDQDDDQSPLGSHSEDPLIRRASQAALQFTETLPSYVCQEMMSRFESESKPASWKALDVISLEVVYENGHENYRNLAIDGKATNKKMNEMDGAWSTGEFGTILIDLFSPATAADFFARGETRIAGITAKLYDFRVERPNSHWSVHVGAQTYQPAYSGSVWVDPQNARVLRIEMEARDLPDPFPTDHVESATDYQYVRLGGTQQFLLPVHAETLSCQRGSSFCSRNTIDFRNYHKYTGESTIEFQDVKEN